MSPLVSNIKNESPDCILPKKECAVESGLQRNALAGTIRSRWIKVLAASLRARPAKPSKAWPPSTLHLSVSWLRSKAETAQALKRRRRGMRDWVRWFICRNQSPNLTKLLTWIDWRKPNYMISIIDLMNPNFGKYLFIFFELNVIQYCGCTQIC